MAITLTTSQQAAAANAASEPVVLIDLVTNSAEVYHFATQPCSYGGVLYAARITDVSQIQAGGGNVPYQLAATKSLTVTFANDDGWFSRQRPGWLRGQPLTYREVFLDVDTPMRTFAFTTVGQSLPSEQAFQVNAEDVLAPVRRKLVPGTDTLITDSLYPNLNRGVFQPGADGRNRPLPFAFGRTYVPLYYVDQASDGSYVYAAGVGSLYYVGSGSVVDWWDGGFSIIGGASHITNDGHSTFPWSVRYAVRNSMREDGTEIAIPVTEIVVHPDLSPGEPQIVRRFADLTWNHGSSAWTTPDEVLVEMFRNCWGGAHYSPTILNSDSLLTAHSFYTANSLFFDGALIEQRPFEDWLAQWQHDAQTRLVFRDQIYLVPCASRTATFSLSDGNVLANRITFSDVPLGQEYSRRLLYYKDRTQDADYGPGEGGQGDARGGSFVRYDVGSAAELTTASPFIGRPSVAQRINTHWGAQQAASQRIYDIPTTVKLAGVEEGDLGTFTNSHVGATNQLVDVYGVTRRGFLFDLSVAETDISVYSFGVTAPDPEFIPLYQRVPYGAGSYQLFTNTVAVFTSSHGMARTPTVIMPYGPISTLLTSRLIPGDTTNNSQFVVENALVALTPGLSFNLNFALYGWSIYASRAR